MKLEIWSDVMCPFCYIGKKHLEKAMSELAFANKIEVDWKSYQLNPEYHNHNHEDLYSFLSRSKGMPMHQVKQMTAHVVEMAENAGIKINFDTNVPANSFDAHRLIHLAKKQKLQNQAEEQLFKAHFTDGKDVANPAVLLEIGKQIGLDETAIKQMLASEQFAEEVNYDIYESKQLGISGVPFFLMNRKYALSGAQPVEAFVEALTQTYLEWEKEQKDTSITNLNSGNDAICDDSGCSI